jgi:hypothetical protein
VEVQGLWLQSDELTGRLLSRDSELYASMAPIVFVPFAQIAGVLVGTKPPDLDPAVFAQVSTTKGGT